MRVLLTTQLRSFIGESLKDGPESDLLLRNVLIGALSSPNAKDDSYAGAALHYALGIKIVISGDEVDFTSDEVELLKLLLPKRFSPLVTGQVGLILDGKETGIISKSS